MARQEADREDILREATALVVRAELTVPRYEESVIIGFRTDGCGSIYFGPGPVYQFNSKRQLRRGYRHGELIKAEKGRLVALRRQRTEDRVLLVRHDFDDEQTKDYLTTLRQHVDRLRTAIEDGEFAVVGQVPQNDDVIESIRQWLASIPVDIEIARVPNAR